MNEEKFNKIQLYVTVIVTLFIWTILALSNYHGGVPSHHLLQRKDLPAVSNWWGGFLLPLVSWICIYRIGLRLRKQQSNGPKLKKDIRNILIGFLGALLFGIILAVSFTLGYSNVGNWLVDALLILFFVVPIFRSEYLLGFIIGMTITFGAILPTAFSLIVASISAVLYNYVRPVLLRLIQLIKGKPSQPGTK
jgi:hypothetical protein